MEMECGPLFQVSKVTKFCVLGLPKPVCKYRNVSCITVGVRLKFPVTVCLSLYRVIVSVVCSVYTQQIN